MENNRHMRIFDKYTIHGSRYEYTHDFGGCPYIDSENNIFPSQVACARFHGVSPSTVRRAEENGKSFFSKSLHKKVCATPMFAINDFEIFDGYHDDQLKDEIQKLEIYDDLFNNYILKGIPAMACGKYSWGWGGIQEIRVYNEN